MIELIILISIIALWFISQVKNSLFWIYLWQLKNYHIGRFKDHFRTKRGKSIFLNFFYISKIIALILFSFNYLIFLPFLIIIFEGLISLFKIIIKKFNYPVFTKKTIFLFTLTILLFVALFKTINYSNIFFLSSKLLLINILTPFIVSFVILILQPFTFLIRSITLMKASNKRKKLKNLKVIGITGSYGKSSTKEFLYTFLSYKYKGVKKTKENFNSEIGISKFILDELNENDNYFVCEMGAYNRGGIKLLCNIADPQIGILTGINNQHLSTFGSQENIVKAKFELIEYVKDFSVLNWDNYLIKNNKKTFSNIYKYSYLEEQDIYATDIKIFKDHIEFNACLKNGEKEYFKVNVLGGHNVSNLLGAIFVAYKLGMNLKEISNAAKNIIPSQGGMTIINNFIDATYSSNANGVMAHLGLLNLWEGKKVIVMPCLIELQKESKRIHKEIGKKIHEICDLAIITTNDNFDDLKEEGKEKVIFENNPNKILEIIKKYNKKEDIILLESRVPSELIKKIRK
ncbi:MAG TPA: Mur ligase family protein [Candidatus Pacearchaeota archaeon]|nr:Mur ligase family protein [Candidatus Pacearchaeota archaeon]